MFVPKNVKAVFDRLKCISANSEKLSHKTNQSATAIVGGLDILTCLSLFFAPRNLWLRFAAHLVRPQKKFCKLMGTGSSLAAVRSFQFNGLFSMVDSRRSSTRRGTRFKTAKLERRGRPPRRSSSSRRRPRHDIVDRTPNRNGKKRQNTRAKFSRSTFFAQIQFLRDETERKFSPSKNGGGVPDLRPFAVIAAAPTAFGREVHLTIRSVGAPSRAFATARQCGDDQYRSSADRDAAAAALAPGAGRPIAFANGEQTMRCPRTKTFRVLCFFRGSRYGVPFRLPGPKIACSSTVR